MTLLMDSTPSMQPSGLLVGAQRPRIHTGPPSVLSEGARVRRLAQDLAGLRLDPWQEWVLDEALGRRADGKWSAFEVALIVARQNGKGAILEALSLAALFLDDFGVNLILHSAHEFKTAEEAFLRIEARIEDNPALRKRVKNIYRAAGKESVTLKNRKRLRFVARSKASGRGFTADLIIMDEAYELEYEAIRAMLPTLSARPNPQIWYTSTAGDERSTKLGSLRDHGIKGDGSRLFFAEWSAGEWDDYLAGRIDLDDPQVWADNNPGMGIRISDEYITAEREAMIDDPAGFAKERLSVSRYPVQEPGWAVVPAKFWDARQVDVPERRRPFAFGVDAQPGQLSAAVCAAFWDGDHVVVEVPEGDHRPETSWVVGRMVELRRKYRPVGVVVDPAGPAAGLIPELERAGVEVVKPAASELGAAFAQFTTGVLEPDGPIRHTGQPELAAALRGATAKDTGDGGKKWTRKDSTVDISPLVAATLAQWALRKHGKGYDLMRSIG